MNVDDVRQSTTPPHIMWIHSGTLARELYAAQHLNITKELRRMGWRVTLVTSGPKEQNTIRGVEVVSIPRPDVYVVRQLAYHTAVIPLILRQQPLPDVVFFHQTSALWLLPLKLIRRVLDRAKMLLVMDSRTVHMPPREKEGFRGRIRRKYFSVVWRIANRWVDGQTAITERLAGAVNIPPKKLWGTWPSGVELEDFVGSRESRSWPDGDRPVELVYIGTLHHERNLIKLCRAVELAMKEGMPFNLLLVGEGTEQEDLNRFSQATDGRIRVLPPISHEQIPQFLSRAHVGVLPFPDEEKFRVSSPIKLFEYMASGLAIFATRIVCHTDVVGEGQYVFWAEGSEVDQLLEGLRRIWHNRTSLPAMGRQAASSAPPWTWEASARKLRAAIEKGLASNR